MGLFDWSLLFGHLVREYTVRGGDLSRVWVCSPQSCTLLMLVNSCPVKGIHVLHRQSDTVLKQSYKFYNILSLILAFCDGSYVVYVKTSY